MSYDTAVVNVQISENPVQLSSNCNIGTLIVERGERKKVRGRQHLKLRKAGVLKWILDWLQGSPPPRGWFFIPPIQQQQCWLNINSNFLLFLRDDADVAATLLLVFGLKNDPPFVGGDLLKLNVEVANTVFFWCYFIGVTNNVYDSIDPSLPALNWEWFTFSRLLCNSFEFHGVLLSYTSDYKISTIP